MFSCIFNLCDVRIATQGLPRGSVSWGRFIRGKSVKEELINKLNNIINKLFKKKNTAGCVQKTMEPYKTITYYCHDY